MRAVAASGYCQAGGIASSTRWKTSWGASSRRARAEITSYRQRSSLARSRSAASSSPWYAFATRASTVSDAPAHGLSMGRPFLLEQRLLALDAPPVAGKAPVAPHHAMAGDGDREAVRRAGLRHGPRGLRRADPGSDLGVRGGLPCRDVAQRLPDALLER